MKPPPAGWPRLSSAIFYNRAALAIPWLCEAFGFEVQLRVDGEHGDIAHSQLVFGEALVMVSEGGEGRPQRFGVPLRSPQALGGANTQSVMIYVDDADAHCQRARQAGARIVHEPKVEDYGAGYWADKSYGALDLEGHLWWFVERVRG
ncbi:VOC family protein [Roseateles amylovorans]|uniref:VOC family protein n=1 Tax=Roseateles amylovorans TaxID=2978473 RepID=A0ABY6AXD5_9BURK|nr:VOC family protein [Roseateles amylovorans]UXH77831.1 VOC family protein [Roseateles amylovorans]